MTYAVILAGGRGERFWPLSSHHVPKQFHCVRSSSSMLQDTLQRVKRLVLAERVYVAASIQHKKIIERQLSGHSLKPQNIFFEPSSKNTLAPVAFLSARIHAVDPEAVIIVLPADHYIDNASRFSQTLQKAVRLAKKNYIVTLGAKPTRPETGYGYIRLGAQLGGGCFKVSTFTEKPSREKAARLLASGKYLWNCGIFVFKAAVMLDEIRRHEAMLYKKSIEALGSRSINSAWQSLRPVSIDYGIMEKTRKAATVRISCAWSDMGNWVSIADAFKKDTRGNVFKGRVHAIDSCNTTIWAEGKVVAALGIKDLIVVSAPEAILVCAKDRVDEVRTLARALQKKGKR